jgi:hypothetical protein
VDSVVVLTLGAACTARVPVLTCCDVLTAAGVTVEDVTAGSDADIDAVLDRMPSAGVIVGAASDGQLRAVVRRLVRRYAPPPSARPADLPADRTLPDLPPLAVLPLGPGGLVDRLGLPTSAAAVAAALLGGRTRRLDLLRNDGGSVTLHGVVLGGDDPFAARIDVDDAVLAEGTEPLLAAVVANADGYAHVDGLPMTVAADPADGILDVAVALPRKHRGRLEIEVRRARGRAVTVTPHDKVPFADDGVSGTLDRRRTWWMEREAWAVYDAAGYDGREHRGG